MANAKTWVEPLARGGYGARGVVYIIIGVFAFLAAFGGSEKTDTKGALQKILQQPFGQVLVWIIIAGLAGYVLWRLVQSLGDTDDHGWSPKGLAIRLGLLASAFTYSALAIYALSLVGFGSSGGGGSDGGGLASVRQFFNGLLSTQIATLCLALIFAGVAIAHIAKAFRQKYEEHFRASDVEMAFIHPVSMIGLIARGLVFVVIAVMLLYRFFNTGEGGDGGDPPGLKDALGFVQGLPLGSWLLAALGLGIVLFGLYSLVEARYRRINVHEASLPG